MATDDLKLKICQEVYIIERDMRICPKKIIAIVTEENEIKYKIEEHSCGGISAKDIFSTKNKAEAVKQEFLNGLRFVVGDLLVFQDREGGCDVIRIGRVVDIRYAKAPYQIKTSWNDIYDVTDDSSVLKINNVYIENFGKLQNLNDRIDIVVREYALLKGLINVEYDLLEKDLKQKFKRQFSHFWFSKKKKPLFRDRFDYQDGL